LQVQKL